MRRRDSARSERGAAAVEFALIVFPLMIIVFGVINYGDLLSVRQSVSQAASEGARAAAVTPGDDAAKRDAAVAAVSDALAAQGHECVGGCGPSIVTFAPCPGGRCATVDVRIAYRGLIPGYGPFLPDTLRYKAVARVS